MSKIKPKAEKIKPENRQKEKKRPKTLKKITASYLHNSGLYYLQRFAASTQQFRTVMTRKIMKSCRAHPDQDFDACVAELEKTIETFVRAGLLNDEIYARAQVSSLRRRGKSARLIAMKLMHKGVNSSLIEQELLQEESAGDAEFRAALILARRKKIGPFARGSDATNKDLAAMARAGYSYDLVQKIFNMKPEEAEEALQEIF